MQCQALLDYERHKTQSGELNVPIASHSEPMNIENQVILNYIYLVTRFISIVTMVAGTCHF